MEMRAKTIGAASTERSVKMTDEIRLNQELTFDEYKSSVGSAIVVVKLRGDVLITAREMARLYGVGRPTITRHLLKLFATRQLNRKRVSSVLTHRAADGKLYETRYYNSAAIVAVGLSLKSPQAEAFQKWLGVERSKHIN
jgi:hypothetical protein